MEPGTRGALLHSDRRGGGRIQDDVARSRNPGVHSPSTRARYLRSMRPAEADRIAHRHRKRPGLTSAAGSLTSYSHVPSAHWDTFVAYKPPSGRLHEPAKTA